VHITRHVRVRVCAMPECKGVAAGHARSARHNVVVAPLRVEPRRLGGRQGHRGRGEVAVR
jgi:hypothetical protein